MEVIPNSTFLDEATLPGLDPDERVRLAHAAAWPKLFTWIRFLDWYFGETPDPPPHLIPDLVPVFSTWQQGCAGQNIRHCRRIGEIAYRWLQEFEEALHPEHFEVRRDPFGIDFPIDQERDLEASIRSLFLFSAADVPELVTVYLKARSRGRLGRGHRKKILAMSMTIGRALPREMVDYIIAAFLVHPKDKPGWRDYSTINSGELGIEGDDAFYPASPSQPPFLGLLRQHEAEGLRLVRTICNHSVAVWRWLRQRPDSRYEAVTPVPVEVEFPWGSQSFWGDGQVYTWFRGAWGNQASRSALMALELWAFERIDAGEDFTSVLRKVLEGNDCVAALGLAVSLCLAHTDKSIEAALPLITCPHIWLWDLHRSVSDQTSMPANEIGDWSRFRHMLEAVRDLNRRPHRTAFIRDVVPYFVFWHEEAVRERYTLGIRAFTENLPFEYAHERDDPDHAAGLRKQMSWYVEQADPQYWRTAPTEDGKHIHAWNDPPSANSPEHVQMRADHAALNRHLRLALWAQKSLDENVVQPGFTLAEALAEAQALDEDDLFERPHESYSEGNRKAAVAGGAYAFARFADAAEWSLESAAWAIDVLQRAATSTSTDALSYRGAPMSKDPLIFAVYGYSALLARGYEAVRCQEGLLGLAVDPFDAVAQAVMTSAKCYASAAPDFYWALFALLVNRTIYRSGEGESRNANCWNEAEAAHNTALLEVAERALAEGRDATLPTIPLPWLAAPDAGGDPETLGYQRNDLHFDWHLAERTLFPVDLDALLSTADRRAAFLLMVEQMMATTIQLIVPPFAENRRDNPGDTPFEWVLAFSHWLGKVSMHLSPDEVRQVVLQAIFATENETALLMMQSFAPSFLAYTMLPPAEFSDDAFGVWETIADWIIDNPESRQRRHVDREFSHCVYALLFCRNFYPLVCVIEEGWKHLDRFVPILERVVTKFGAQKSLYLGVARFFKRGGLDLMPDPALQWLRAIAADRKQDQEFWTTNGDETVEILKLVLSKKADVLSSGHRETISFITDILVDSGVRGAGFLQQDKFR